ncbi:MAG TPA: ABC transporter substrate-binding protein [Stellaceae bacterium]|nr:ABC transporter substrate-binding protein [Stellaceae bacterium]
MKRRDVLSGLLVASVLPHAARGQQPGKVPTIGVLWHAGSPEEEEPFFSALRHGFKDLGYIEGQNIRLEHRFPNEVPERFKSMLADLVALHVDVIVSVTPASYYAKDATGTIPHVFVFVPDPVGLKFVESLSHPGGNATGLSLFMVGLTGKRVQLLHDVLPGFSSFGFLVNPNPSVSGLIAETQAAAKAEGLTLQTFEARSLDDLEGAFDSMTRAGIQALVVAAQGLFYQGQKLIGKLALAHRLPISVGSREFMEGDGAFMAYGPSLAAIMRRAPVYVDKILSGAKPSEIPVEQPTKFELLFNLKVAKSLGINVPPTMLAAANEVIE